MYKNNKIYLGSSDVASLTIRHPQGVAVLGFEEDSNYYAYVVNDSSIIPAHYKRVISCTGWLWIFDDDGQKTTFEGDNITIWRAGMRSCIVCVE